MNDNQCTACGCTIGGGCPESTPEEIYAHRSSYPEDYSKEEIQEAKEKVKQFYSPFEDPIEYHESFA